MTTKWRKLAAILFASMLGLAFAGPSVANEFHPHGKCNSGNGNGSETTPATDCDPGNSGGNNNGGD